MKFLNQICFDTLPEAPTILEQKGKQKIRYLNTSNSFDIETTSFYDFKGEKRACMYLFMFCIDGITFYGRTWTQFSYVLEELKRRYKLDFHNRMVIYVHNLSYEFQFMIGHCALTHVFARTKRHPMKCLVNGCFEFRCSYFLSGLSLEKTADEIPGKPVKKLVGDLDYRKIRHWKTTLTEDELAYGENDVLVVYYFIKNEIKKCGNITEIPLTKTGYVRLHCRKYIQEHTNYKNYRNKLSKASPVSEELFTLLNKAFAGGYTHANCNYILDIVPDVKSIDFQSSYPAQMLGHKFPMTPFTRRTYITEETFKEYVAKYACVFEICLTDVEAISPHHIWSVSKCKYGTTKAYKALVDNGRLVKSQEIYTYMTDIDYINFTKFYKCNIKEVHNLWTSCYDYLPKEIIECVLDFYGDKTTLKDVAGKEEIYLIAKGMLNAMYGMCVTNPVNDNIIFDEENPDPKKMWDIDRPSIFQALQKAYSNPKQFLNYQWGVWVTAWARYELFNGLIAFGNDALYSDTDSIKYINYDKYDNYIKEYNENVRERINETLIHYNIDPERARPLDSKGRKRQLGIWEDDGYYDYFKTLGAKRYAYEIDDKLHITVSGLNKKMVYEDEVDDEPEFDHIKDHDEKLRQRELRYRKCPVQYIIDNGGLNFFNDDMVIPAEYSKRLVHTYSRGLEDHYKMQLTDYNGVTAEVEEYSYIHLEPTSFSLSFAEEFYQFLVGIENGYIMRKREKRTELCINELEKEIEVL